MTETEIDTRVVGSGEDAITYDIQGDLSLGRPLLLFGAPMDASGFRQLAAQFPERPVVTFDPRGAGRNPTATSDISVEQHLTDAHRVIAALDCGAVDAFASSGGAVTLLALAATHPDVLRMAIAHEPPSAPLLPDAQTVLAITQDMKRTYLDAGEGTAMAKFIAFVMFEGELPSDYLEGPAPDPALFGMTSEDDGSRSNPLFRNMPAIIEYEPAVSNLRALGDRLVLAAGIESGATMAARGARAIAGAIGSQVAEFPSHHGGFMDAPGYPGDPVGFGARLREILDR